MHRVRVNSHPVFLSIQTLSYQQWGNGYVYRGGVSVRRSEPDYEFARGHNCDEVCATIYDRFMSNSGATLFYARCKYGELGNGEQVAQINTDISTMISNRGTSRAQFISSCTGLS